jgi:hypothetical protein
MEPVNRIEIIDSEGWRKEFEIGKRIIYIGSDPRNDIVLSSFRGSGVEKRHIQIITPQAPSFAITAVNLSTTPVPFGDEGQHTLQPNSAVEFSNNETAQLGDFVLLFRLQNFQSDSHAPVSPAEPASSIRGKQTSASIGLKLTMHSASLRPGTPLDSVITVRNQGSAQGVQFQISIDGYPKEFYEIGAAPILFPGAEKNVSLRFHHPCSPILPAGPVRVTVHASALEAYPGENVSVSREIQVEPFYHHQLQVIEK